MEVYLVGGAVRDGLLDRPVTERDWVVVGGAAEALLKAGYKRVGRDFPVFLHPQTHEEYALARTERKTAAGHTGFATDAGAEITLEADLARRDLTINAMARDSRGRLVDPFNGQRDLQHRCLRHVTEAFAEDPLRVFRVARFAASLEGFAVHPDTQAFMAGMAAALPELSAERVWQEFRKALAAPAPQRFLEVLIDCGCLTFWLPELRAAVIDTAPDGPLARYAGLGWTLEEADMSALGRRLKAPKAYLELAADIARWGGLLADWRMVDPAALNRALSAINAYRDRQRRDRTFAAIEDRFPNRMAALTNVLGRIAQTLAQRGRSWQGLPGVELGRRMRTERIALLARFQRRNSPPPPNPNPEAKPPQC